MTVPSLAIIMTSEPWICPTPVTQPPHGTFVKQNIKCEMTEMGQQIIIIKKNKETVSLSKAVTRKRLPIDTFDLLCILFKFI